MWLIYSVFTVSYLLVLSDNSAYVEAGLYEGWMEASKVYTVDVKYIRLIDHT